MIEAIKGFFSSFEPAQWVVVFSAVIGAGVSIWASLRNGREEKKMNQKKIDADLVAKARIQWIQDVREHTAELLSIYYGILNETDKDKLFEKVQEAKKHSDILILFFGETKKDIKYDESVLEETTSNDNKNGMMVLKIGLLFERVNQYYKDCMDNKLGKLQETYKQAKQTMFDFPIREEFRGYFTNDYGEDIPEYEPIPDPQLERETEKAGMELQNYFKSIRDIHIMMYKLSDYMRLYLKIEWDTAKQGK